MMTTDYTKRERSPARNGQISSYREREGDPHHQMTPLTPKTPITPKTPLPVLDYNSEDYWKGTAVIPPCNWIYSMEEIEKDTPSRKHDTYELSFTDEIQKRAKGIIYMFNCCRQLRLSRSVAMTGAFYFHRFYMRKDMISHHYFEIAATCIFIACKSDECRRRLSDVVKVCAKIALQGKLSGPIDENSKVYWKWKDLITHLEEVILETLCFEVNPENSYKHCLRALKLEENLPANDEWSVKSKNIFMNSTNFFELTSRLPLLLIYETNVISSVGLILCSKKENAVMPKGFFETEIDTTVEDSWNCYQDLITLAQCLDKLDPHFQVLPHIPTLTYDDFISISNVETD